MPRLLFLIGFGLLIGCATSEQDLQRQRDARQLQVRAIGWAQSKSHPCQESWMVALHRLQTVGLTTVQILEIEAEARAEESVQCAGLERYLY